MQSNFMLGSGLAAGVIREIERWLAACGVHGSAKLKGVPVGKAVFKRLLGRGVARYRIVKNSLQVLGPGGWTEVVHRDDVQNWLFGRKVELRVGQAPDPAEHGVEVPVEKITPTTKIDGVVEWEKLGPKEFRCEACGLVRKTEKGIIAHIERDH